MVRELRENIGMPFEKDHLKNRLKTLKNNFKECFDIFNGANGFVWSPENKMWVAKPETWKAFVKGCLYFLTCHTSDITCGIGASRMLYPFIRQNLMQKNG